MTHSDGVSYMPLTQLIKRGHFNLGERGHYNFGLTFKNLVYLNSQGLVKLSKVNLL